MLGGASAPMPRMLRVALVALIATAAAGGNAALDRIVSDRRVHLVEFMSGRCGTCQEFLPEWNKLGARVGKSLRVMSFDIDMAPGLAAAKAANVLTLGGGIPTVRLYDSMDSDLPSFKTLLVGEVGTAAALAERIHAICAGLAKDADGRWLKRGSGGEALRRLRGAGPPLGTAESHDARHPLLLARNFWWVLIGGGVAATIIIPLATMVLKLRREWEKVKAAHEG